MYIPFDRLDRNVASIVYIPNKTVFKKILDNYDFKKSDMDNFPIIKQKTNLVQQFPITISSPESDDENKFVSANFDKIQYIFDAAAIGQYLGGVHEIHNNVGPPGFVNPDCSVKYDKYQFEWQTIDGMKKPFIIIDGVYYPIFNLHIHSKKLQDFI